MLGEIGFENYKISCFIGCLPIERKEKQEIYVNLKVTVDMARSIVTDELQDTIDVVKLAEVCMEVVKSRHYQLIETYATAVLQQLMNRFSLHKAWIQIKKPNGLSHADYSVVEFTKKQ